MERCQVCHDSCDARKKEILAKKPINDASITRNLRNQDCVKCTTKSKTFCWNKQMLDMNKEMFGICVDDGECPSGHKVISEVNECPIEPSNVEFGKICTQGNVYGMSSNAPKSQGDRKKVCDDGNFKTNLAALSKRLVTQEQDCAAYCETKVKLDGTEITEGSDEQGVCSNQGLAEVKAQAKAVQKASQDAMKLRTQVHNKEFHVRIDYADVHFRRACMPQIPRLSKEQNSYVPRERWIEAVEAIYNEIELKCHLRAYRYAKDYQLQELTAHIVVQKGTFNEVTTKTDEKNADKFEFVLEPRGRPKYRVERVECRVVGGLPDALCDMEGFEDIGGGRMEGEF